MSVLVGFVSMELVDFLLVAGVAGLTADGGCGNETFRFTAGLALFSGIVFILGFAIGLVSEAFLCNGGAGLETGLDTGLVAVEDGLETVEGGFEVEVFLCVVGEGADAFLLTAGEFTVEDFLVTEGDGAETFL